MTAIAINGAAGRMGRTITSLLADDPRYQLLCALTHEKSNLLGRDIGLLAGSSELGVVLSTLSQANLRDVEVVIDFSLPKAIEALLEICTAQRLGLVIGTTGFNNHQMNLITHAAGEIPILVAPNMSIGINVSFSLIEHATRMLDPEVDIEIYESHHRNKLDSPSGTAKRMGEIVASTRKQVRAGKATSETVGVADQKHIEFHSARGGDVVGEHTVTFFGKGERLEITHRASSRTNFAAGALLAATFVAQKLYQEAPGIHSMNEVLGLS